MRKFLSFVLFISFNCINIFTSIEAGEVSRKKYLELIKLYPNLIQSQGDFSKGEIQIVLDPQEMAAIEKATARDVGVIMQDKYWLWVAARRETMEETGMLVDYLSLLGAVPPLTRG